MTTLATVPSNASSSQIALAAERFAAAQFARCGFDVSVQSASDRPVYDLVVAKAGALLKVSVKGSQDGGWSLTQSYLKRTRELGGTKIDYQAAIDLWLDHHSSRTICCLVQFQGVEIDELPRIYLASTKEVAQRLRRAARGRGDSILYEECEWIFPGEVTGTVEKLPSNWLFSSYRIETLLAEQEAGTVSKPVHSPEETTTRVHQPADTYVRGSRVLLPLTA